MLRRRLPVTGSAARDVVSTRNTFGHSGEVQRNGFVVTNAHNAIAGIPFLVALSELEWLPPCIQ